MKNEHLIPASSQSRNILLAASLVLFLGGCSSTPPAPDTQMAVAEAAVNNANNATTSEHAPRELQVAVSKLASARQAYERKDYAEARKLAEEAELDARMAVIRAQAVSAEKSAKESQEAARVLRDEINRSTTN